MGLLKEILDKIDVHQDPIYLDNFNLMMKKDYENRQKSKGENDSSSIQINITIMINDDEDE